LDGGRVENSSPARPRVGDVDVADAHRTAHGARCRGTPFTPPDVGWGASLGSPRSTAAASRERTKIDGDACGAAKRSRTERAALVPGWSALQRRLCDRAADGLPRACSRGHAINGVLYGQRFTVWLRLSPADGVPPVWAYVLFVIHQRPSMRATVKKSTKSQPK